MGEPYRLTWVLVLLDAFDACGTGLSNFGRRAAHRIIHAARRISRPRGEVLSSLIFQRIRKAKAPSATPSTHW